MVSKQAKITFIKTMLSQQMLDDGVPQQYVDLFVQSMDEYLSHGIITVKDHRFKDLMAKIKSIIENDKMEHLINQGGNGQVNALIIKAVDVAEPLAGRHRRRRYPGGYVYDPYYGWYNWWYGVPNYWSGWYWNTRPLYLNYGWTRVGAAKGRASDGSDYTSFKVEMPKNVLSMNTVCDDDDICVSTIRFTR